MMKPIIGNIASNSQNEIKSIQKNNFSTIAANRLNTGITFVNEGSSPENNTNWPIVNSQYETLCKELETFCNEKCGIGFRVKHGSECKSKKDAILRSVENPYIFYLYYLSTGKADNGKLGGNKLIMLGVLGKILKNNAYLHLLTFEIQKLAFLYIFESRSLYCDPGFITGVIRVYKLEDVKVEFSPMIREKYNSTKKYDESVQMVNLLNLYEEFTAEEILIPLLLQGHLSHLKKFIFNSPAHCKPVLSFINNMLGAESLDALYDHYRQIYPFGNQRKIRIVKRSDNKLVEFCDRFITSEEFDLNLDHYPNIMRKVKIEKLRLLLIKYYKRKGVEEADFHKNIDEMVTNGNDKLVQIELIKLLQRYNYNDAVSYANKYNLNVEDIPPPPQNIKSQTGNWANKVRNNEII